MNTKDIEVRLERSLRQQVSLPRLDSRFNAAVWQRIAAQEVPAASPSPRSTRWLLAANLLGIAVSLALLVYAVARESTGIQIEVSPALPVLPTVPALSDQALQVLTQSLGWVVSGAAVAFGMAFTRSGRRVIDYCRSEFI